MDALAAAGETVVAGMRDPRAWIAEGARRASGTAAGQQSRRHRPTRPDGTGGGRPGAADPALRPSAVSRLRAPNQKPDRNPAHKPGSLPATAVPPRMVGRPGAGATTGRPGAGGPGNASAGHASTAAAPACAPSTSPTAAPGPAPSPAWTGCSCSCRRRRRCGSHPDPVHRPGDGGERRAARSCSSRRRARGSTPARRITSWSGTSSAPAPRTRSCGPTVLMQTLSTLYRDDIRLRGEIVVPAGGARVAVRRRRRRGPGRRAGAHRTRSPRQGRTPSPGSRR